MLMNKYALHIALKKEITPRLLLEFAEVYQLNITKLKPLEYIVTQVVKQNKKPLKYALEMQEKFTIKQYKKLLNYTKHNNKYDSMSKEFHKAKYGDEWEPKYNARKITVQSTLEQHIIRYGEKEGKKRYKKHNKKNSRSNKIKAQEIIQSTPDYYDKTSKKSYISRYGEKDGIKAYNNYTKTMKNIQLQKFQDDDFRIKFSQIMKNVAPKVRAAHEKSGNWTQLKDLTEYKLYKRDVKIETNTHNLSGIPDWDKRGNRTTNPDAYELDHKISIQYGFKNKIHPKTIGGIDNLQYIHWLENAQKYTKCYTVLKPLSKPEK